MAKPSLFKKRDSWGNHEERVLAIFSLALQKLRDESSLPRKENEISHILLTKVKEARFDLSKKDKSAVIPSISFDAQNRLGKKPDFHCEIFDALADDPQKSSKIYHLEAKRLGSQTSRFNKEYVVNGIQRFIKSDYCYGEFVKSGAMIGYVQDMELDDILEQVNDYASKEEITKLSLSSDAWNEDINRLDHQLKRPEVEPNLFDLRHIWVDLRHHY